MSPAKTIVIGAGAAGLMAAGQAALAGAEVTLIEKMAQPGRKIGISGKGRCNLTNVADLGEFIDHFGKNGQFLRQCFGRFFTGELIEFFADQGLAVVVERGGRVFPASGKALDVVRVFKRWLGRLPVTMIDNCRVSEIVVSDGRVRGVKAAERFFPADTVILATGGASYPLTGSTGDGYKLAEVLGHRIMPIRPALVPLTTAGDLAGKMAGLSLRNVGVELLVDGKRRGREFGELSFTETGLSGPVILTLSGACVDFLQAGKAVNLAIDLKPALTIAQLDGRIDRDFNERTKETLVNVLRGLLPKEMVPICLAATNLAAGRLAGQTGAKERQRLRAWLKDFRLEISGHRPLAEAIITAGGVALTEIDPRTMASKIVTGLYLAGEVLDLQADTGGYNLQAAFSTGWLAGRSAGQMADSKSLSTESNETR